MSSYCGGNVYSFAVFCDNHGATVVSFKHHILALLDITTGWLHALWLMRLYISCSEDSHDWILTINFIILCRSWLQFLFEAKINKEKDFYFTNENNFQNTYSRHEVDLKFVSPFLERINIQTKEFDFMPRACCTINKRS